MTDLRETLRRQIMDAEGALLVTHHRRGALFLVASEVSLLDVAEAIARDDTEKVGAWIEAGAIARPPAGEVERWERGERAAYRFVIVQPYVLAQPLG